MLFAGECRNLDYFDDLLEDWDSPFQAAGIALPGSPPSVFEVIGMATDTLYSEPSVVLVQALTDGAFVEVVLSDVIPEPIAVSDQVVEPVQGRRARRERRADTLTPALSFGRPLPSPFGTTAGDASVAMVNVVVQGTRTTDEGDRDVFVETQISFLTPSGEMVVAYDKVRTGTAISGWTFDECYGPGYEPDGWGDTACLSSFVIPSTSPPGGIEPVFPTLPSGTFGRAPWSLRGGSGTTRRNPQASGNRSGGAERLTVGGAMVSGCEAAINDSGALKGTLSNGICMGAGAVGALAGTAASYYATPMYAFYNSTLTLGGPEVGVKDVMDFHFWLIAEGYEAGADLCNESMNEGLSIEITGCQLDVLNSRDGVENQACQSGRIRATFRIESSEDCNGGSATCEATGTQTCSWEGDCDTCDQDWDGTALCECN